MVALSRAVSHSSRVRGPEPHSCEDVNADSIARAPNYLYDIATIGISNGTPSAV